MAGTMGTKDNDTLVGTQANELYQAKAGKDSITFGWGADTVLAGDGDDSMSWSLPSIHDDAFVYIKDFLVDQVVGGRGSDSLTVSMTLLELATVAVVTAPGGIRSVLMDGKTVLQMTQVEAVSLAMPDHTSLVGYEGGVGRDSLFLGSGQHVANLRGGIDYVSILIDELRDVIDMGSGANSLLLKNTTFFQPMVFDLATGSLTVGGVERALITGVKDFDAQYSVAGSDLTIRGTEQDNDFVLGTGKLTLDTRGGNDTVRCYLSDHGTKTIAAGSGEDEVRIFGGRFFAELNGPGFHLTATRGGKFEVRFGQETLVTTTGIEHFGLQGSNGRDVMEGGAGNDSLGGLSGDDRMMGKGGDDLLVGSLGRDVLTGGHGADTFWYALGPTQEGGLMVATDFGAEDSLALYQSSWKTYFDPVTGAPLVAGANPVATKAALQLLYNTTTGDLSVDIDGTGSDAAVLIAQLLNGGSAAVLSVDQIGLY